MELIVTASKAESQLTLSLSECCSLLHSRLLTFYSIFG